jgi:hypothetical protein
MFRDAKVLCSFGNTIFGGALKRLIFELRTIFSDTFN